MAKWEAFILNMLTNIILYLDWGAVKAKLGGMDLDQLKKFIEEKGNARKKDLYDTCIFQTTDATHTKVLSDKLDHQLDLARKNQDKFN